VLCGVSRTQGWCSQCNATGDLKNAKSALKNNVGKTCKWAIATPYTTAYSLTISSVAQATDCPVFATADKTADEGLISTLVKNQGLGNLKPFDSTTVPAITCTVQAAGAGSLIPSLALLGLIAAIVA